MSSHNCNKRLLVFKYLWNRKNWFIYTNEYARGSIGVASIVDKMRENRLRWFKHVMRREIGSYKNGYGINVEKKKGKRSDAIESDMFLEWA